MPFPLTRRQVTSAIWAGLIVAIGAVGMFAQIGTVGAEGLMPWVASVPVLPGFFAALFLGLGRGADEFPTQDDVAPYVIAFGLWWMLIDQGRAWWRQKRARARSRRSPNKHRRRTANGRSMTRRRSKPDSSPKG